MGRARSTGAESLRAQDTRGNLTHSTTLFALHLGVLTFAIMFHFSLAVLELFDRGTSEKQSYAARYLPELSGSRSKQWSLPMDLQDMMHRGPPVQVQSEPEFEYDPGKPVDDPSGELRASADTFSD